MTAQTLRNRISEINAIRRRLHERKTTPEDFDLMRRRYNCGPDSTLLAGMERAYRDVLRATERRERVAS